MYFVIGLVFLKYEFKYLGIVIEIDLDLVLKLFVFFGFVLEFDIVGVVGSSYFVMFVFWNFVECKVRFK